MNSKYKAFAKELEKDINSGQYGDSGKLPSERTLAQDYGISRVAVRMGMELLRNKGLIESIAGKGCFVKTDSSAGKTEKTGLIGVIFAGRRTVWPSNEMLDVICRELDKHNFSVIFSGADDSLTDYKKKLRTVWKQGVDGILTVPVYRKTESWEGIDETGCAPFINEIRTSGVPVVMLDRSYNDREIPSVCNDDVSGGRMAAEYLASKGCKKVCALFNFRSNIVGYKRGKGFCSAAKELDMEVCEFDAQTVLRGRRHITDAEWRQALHDYFNEHQDIDGVFSSKASSNIVAELIVQGNASGRLRELIGYDFSPQYADRSFAWLKRPITEIAARSSSMLVKLIDGEKVEASYQCLEPELITPDNTNSPCSSYVRWERNPQPLNI